ncbi:MAG: pyridoxal phosphate-dependent aminotransferase, partial [Candidatus Micrarchaeota archaeon]
IVFEPCYVQYVNQLEMSGYEIRKIKNVWELEQKITESTVAILFIDPDNPTGRVADLREVEEIVRVAWKHKIPIIWDRIYMDLTHDGKPPVDIHKINPRAAIITFYGLAKMQLLTGERMGFIIAQGEGLENFKVGMLNWTSAKLGAPHGGQYAAFVSLTDPRMEENRKAMNKELGERAKIVIEGTRKANALIKEKHPERSLELFEDPKGAFYAFFEFKGPWKTGDEFACELMEYSAKEKDKKFVAVASGVPFLKKKGFRIAMLCKEGDDLGLAMEKIGRFMANA